MIFIKKFMMEQFNLKLKQRFLIVLLVRVFVQSITADQKSSNHLCYSNLSDFLRNFITMKIWGNKISRHG